MAAGGQAAPSAASELAAFLRTELASTPGRAGDALRITAACLAASVVVMGLHVPYGDWIVWSIVQVSGEDTGASLIRAAQRIAATLVGGLTGLLIGIAFADEPQFMFPTIGLVVAVGMFLSRTTSWPQAAVLGAFTMVLVVASRLDSPDSQIETALWRVLLVLIGVVLGTAAQLLLWPRDPETRLLEQVGRQLEAVERLLIRTAEATAGAAGEPGPTDLVAASGLARALDLLANVEARYPSLRRRHTEQIALITEGERLLTSAVWLEASQRDPRYPYRVDAPMRARLRALAAACARLREGLTARHPTRPADVPYPFEGVAETGPRLWKLVSYMETTVSRMAAATGFLGPTAAGAARFLPRRSPLDSPARAPFLMPAFSASNSSDVKFALKCALAVEICIVIGLGLNSWSGMLTAAVTCLLVAGSSFGASLYKSLLRLVGATVGGLLGLLVMATVMPNVETLAWLLPVFGACFLGGAWIMVGSSRIAYAGLQICYAFAIATVDAFGPTIDLVPSTNRVLGVLLGIIVMGVVSECVWPVRASRAMRRVMATAVRSMAQLAELERAEGGYAAEVSRAARHRLAIYRDLATVLRLREEASLERGARAPEAVAERDRILHLAGDAQGVFLALLALARHRLETHPSALGPSGREVAAFDRAVHQTLDAIAAAIEGDGLHDLQRELERLEATRANLASRATPADSGAVAQLAREVEVRRYIAGHIERLARQVLDGDARPPGPGRDQG